nr:hypothetical protein [Bacteroidota bacterium]
MKISLITTLLIVLFLILPRPLIWAQHDDLHSWTQFRGNERNGISAERDLLDIWPEQGPELIWKKEIGTSFSELLISDKRVYTITG